MKDALPVLPMPTRTQGATLCPTAFATLAFREAMETHAPRAPLENTSISVSAQVFASVYVSGLRTPSVKTPTHSRSLCVCVLVVLTRSILLRRSFLTACALLLR